MAWTVCFVIYVLLKVRTAHPRGLGMFDFESNGYWRQMLKGSLELETL